MPELCDVVGRDRHNTGINNLRQRANPGGLPIRNNFDSVSVLPMQHMHSEQSLRASAKLGPVYDAKSSRRAAGIDVFGYRECSGEAEFLKDTANAQVLCVQGAVDANLRAIAIYVPR